MKKFIKTVTKILDFVFGLGIFICLFVGGATFFGYLAAFIIGGDIAAAICNVIYNYIFKVLIYGGNVIVLIGLLNMYLKKQKSLTISGDTSKKDAESASDEQSEDDATQTALQADADDIGG